MAAKAGHNSAGQSGAGSSASLLPRSVAGRALIGAGKRRESSTTPTAGGAGDCLLHASPAKHCACATPRPRLPPPPAADDNVISRRRARILSDRSGLRAGGSRRCPTAQASFRSALLPNPASPLRGRGECLPRPRSEPASRELSLFLGRRGERWVPGPCAGPAAAFSLPAAAAIRSRAPSGAPRRSPGVGMLPITARPGPDGRRGARCWGRGAGGVFPPPSSRGGLSEAAAVGAVGRRAGGRGRGRARSPGMRGGLLVRSPGGTWGSVSGRVASPVLPAPTRRGAAVGKPAPRSPGWFSPVVVGVPRSDVLGLVWGSLWLRSEACGQAAGIAESLRCLWQKTCCW